MLSSEINRFSMKGLKKSASKIKKEFTAKFIAISQLAYNNTVKNKKCIGFYYYMRFTV